MAAHFLSTRIINKKWSGKIRFGKIYLKIATQIMIFFPHAQINLTNTKKEKTNLSGRSKK